MNDFNLLNEFLLYAADYIKNYIDFNHTIELTTGSGFLARLIGIPYIILSPLNLADRYLYDELTYKQHRLITNIKDYEPDNIILGVYDNLFNDESPIVNNPVYYGVNEQYIYDMVTTYIVISDKKLYHSDTLMNKVRILHTPSWFISDHNQFRDLTIKIWSKKISDFI